jgi:hypothetical protein
MKIKNDRELHLTISNLAALAATVADIQKQLGMDDESTKPEKTDE